eukprot:4609883-Prymnesium_polylepis.1
MGESCGWPSGAATKAPLSTRSRSAISDDSAASFSHSPQSRPSRHREVRHSPPHQRPPREQSAGSDCVTALTEQHNHTRLRLPQGALLLREVLRVLSKLLPRDDDQT